MRVWLLLLLIWSAGTQTPEADPAQPIRNLAAAIQALPSPVTAEALETPIASEFDLGAFALAALGDHAKSASTPQLTRLARISGRRFAVEVIDQWPDEAPAWNITESRPLEAGGWVVTTVSEPAGRDPETLQWLIVPTDVGLRIADVLKGGTSYAATFGREIDRALRTRTLDDVLTRLEERYGLAEPPP